MTTVLIVDDEAPIRFAIREILEDRGHDVIEAASGEAALARLDDADLVLTDLAMPGMDGLALLTAIRERTRGTPVVLLTARGTEKTAVLALKGGAFDYLTKPFDVGELVRTVERAAEVAALRSSEAQRRAERATGRAVVARAPEMARLIDKTLRLARRDIPVLIRGETGTGKEIIASLLHAESARAERPLVRFNCAAIPSELAEAELFGHVKGAFTGAIAARRGFFREADGGTLVLDEVGELPLALQAKLLRAVQEGEIQPVGAGKVERVDVRVVSSTNRDLAREVAEKRFREDLFYRLGVVELVVPPLRDRREDIPALARVFAARYAERFGVERVSLSAELVAELSARAWPGNVRELESTLARLVATSEDGMLTARDLEPREERRSSGETFREKVSAYERALIEEALEASDGNQSEAARRLGMSRVTLIDRIKRLAADRP